VVGCVYCRHTTKYDGTWVCWILTADVNVRTLGGARCGAPVPGRGIFVRDGGLCRSAMLRWVCVWISKWVARELSGGHNSNFGKLRLSVCTVSCLYGSIDLGELGSVRKRWTVHVVQRALCPRVFRSSGGQALSEDGRRCSFELPTHLCCCGSVVL
jgi:hypothetical protein